MSLFVSQVQEKGIYIEYADFEYDFGGRISSRNVLLIKTRERVIVRSCSDWCV